MCTDCAVQMHVVTDSSTPAVVRCVVGVGGAIWVDKRSDSLFTHDAQAGFT